MSKAGSGEGSRPGPRARAADAAPAPQDVEPAGRDYRRARELLWMAAHDLSAPLGAIRMHVRAKERQNARAPLTGDEWMVALGRIERLVENAQTMIDDVLAVERLRHRPPEPASDAALVDAERVLAGVIAMQAVPLKRAGCSVFVKRRDDLDRVFGGLESDLPRAALREPHSERRPARARRAHRGLLRAPRRSPPDSLRGRRPRLAARGELRRSGRALRRVGRRGRARPRPVDRLSDRRRDERGDHDAEPRCGEARLAFDIRLPFGEGAAEAQEGADQEEDDVSGGDQAVECGQP